MSTSVRCRGLGWLGMILPWHAESWQGIPSFLGRWTLRNLLESQTTWCFFWSRNELVKLWKMYIIFLDLGLPMGKSMKIGHVSDVTSHLHVVMDVRFSWRLPYIQALWCKTLNTPDLMLTLFGRISNHQRVRALWLQAIAPEVVAILLWLEPQGLRIIG